MKVKELSELLKEMPEECELYIELDFEHHNVGRIRYHNVVEVLKQNRRCVVVMHCEREVPVMIEPGPM